MDTSKWKKDSSFNHRTKEIVPIYKADFGKIHIVYKINSGILSLQGRIIDIYTKSNYLNFDDFEEPEKVVNIVYQKINDKLNKLFSDDFTVDISQMKVTQIEYSFNVQTNYVSEYIKFINLAYKENRDSVFKRHTNFTIEKNKPIDSSFYLKTNTDYKKKQKVNFCLNVYNKSDQLKNKAKKDTNRFGKTSVTDIDIENSNNILRIEDKVFYKRIKNICKKHKIENKLENLLNLNIAYEQVCGEINRFFTSGDFCSKSYVLNTFKKDCYALDLETPIDKLSASKINRRKAFFKTLDICPCFYIPQKWNIERMDNPIKLINKKLSDKYILEEKIYMIPELKEYEYLKSLPDEEMTQEENNRFWYLLTNLDELEKQNEREEKKKQRELENAQIIAESKNKRILNPRDVSAIMDMGKNQTYALFSSKGFPSFKMNGKYVVESEAFNEWLHDNRGKCVNF